MIILCECMFLLFKKIFKFFFNPVILKLILQPLAISIACSSHISKIPYLLAGIDGNKIILFQLKQHKIPQHLLDGFILILFSQAVIVFQNIDVMNFGNNFHPFIIHHPTYYRSYIPMF
jgi:hypothetical protein